MAYDKKDIKQEVVATLLAAMEAGVCPWRKPWKSTGLRPQNISGHIYQGMNWFTTSMMPYPLPIFMTFGQAKKLGGSVRKGEHACCTVMNWQFIKKLNKATGKEETFPLIKAWKVFNIAQCDGIELPKRIKKQLEATVNPFTPIQAAENLWAFMPQPPSIRHGGDRACYTPALDEIHMPTPESFSIPEEYYSTLFHEATHSTGHKSRLARKEVMSVGMFGGMDYSLEELVAEMGAAILCAECGIDQPVLENSAAYLRSWYEKLSKDPMMLIMAAGRAAKAATYIIGKVEEEVPEDEAVEQAVEV